MSVFLCVRKLAQGPATEVFLAHLGDAPERRVVEILRPELTEHVELVGRFVGEAELRLRETPPGFLPWAELGRTEGGSPYALSAPLPSETLRSRLLKRGPVSLMEALVLGLRTCEALRARGAPFGKLSPEGVLLNGVEELATLQLLDFGLTLSPVAHKRPPAWLPPEYRPPELLRGEGLTESSDVYAVGLLLWEGLAGTSPFRGLTLDETTRRQLERESPPLPERAAALGPLVESCLKKLPHERPTLSSVEGALRRVYAVEELRVSRRAWDIEDEEPMATEPGPVTVLEPPSPPEVPAPREGVPRRGGRAAMLGLGLCLAGMTALAPRHSASMDGEDLVSPVLSLEAATLGTYWQACTREEERREQGLEPQGMLKAWLLTQGSDTALAVNDAAASARCALRANFLLPRPPQGRRPLPRAERSMHTALHLP